MLLAIDIGNTNISLGLFKGNQLLGKYEIPTKNKAYHKSLKKIIGKGNVIDTVICSVVPQTTKRLKKDLELMLGIHPYILGQDIKVPIKNSYRKPNEIGQDRLVNAYAGVTLYGSPLIVVDFGTAVTFDVITKNKVYLGGMILPGLRISLESLAQETALLPSIRLDNPKEFIGRDTKNSMLSGIVYGFAALTDDLTQRIKSRIGKNALVVGTGGNIAMIKKYCNNFDKINADLTLEGIRLIYKKTFDFL